VKRVVERCPTCGVEHEDYAAEGCEACGTALRYWCRAHSREAGWLETPECRRCAEEAARPTPAPRPRTTPPATRPPKPAGNSPRSSPKPPLVRPPGLLRPAEEAPGESGARLLRYAPQTVIGNVILVLLAGVVAGGLAAWGERHWDLVFLIGQWLLLARMVFVMVSAAIGIIAPRRARRR